MLKIELTFEYTKIKKERLTHFSQFSSVKFEKIFKKISASISGKVKKIEALGK